MKKRIIASALALVMILSLCACGENGPKLVGSYEDSLGLVGVIQFNKDGTFYLSCLLRASA